MASSRDTALKKIRDKSYVNMELHETGIGGPRRVEFKPTLKTTEVHIELYKLMEEYVNLQGDFDRCMSSHAKGLITKRMDFLLTRIAHDFWVFDTKRDEYDY